MGHICCLVFAGGASRAVGNVLGFGPPLHRALSGGLYANPLEMAIQSEVARSQAKDDGLLVSWQLMECVLEERLTFLI